MFLREQKHFPAVSFLLESPPGGPMRNHVLGFWGLFLFLTTIGSNALGEGIKTDILAAATSAENTAVGETAKALHVTGPTPKSADEILAWLDTRYETLRGGPGRRHAPALAALQKEIGFGNESFKNLDELKNRITREIRLKVGEAKKVAILKVLRWKSTELQITNRYQEAVIALGEIYGKVPLRSGTTTHTLADFDGTLSTAYRDSFAKIDAYLAEQLRQTRRVLGVDPAATAYHEEAAAARRLAQRREEARYAEFVKTFWSQLGPDGKMPCRFAHLYGTPYYPY